MLLDSRINTETLPLHYRIYNHNHHVLPSLSQYMQYRIIKEKSLKTLEEEVNAALAEGWVPTGGPMNLPFGFAGYFQAVVME